ncbi:hypothetical protein [Paenibacillus sp. B01]|uniref:hypothetical protein n=1 Tax=Paenibacillus sp. B01 TaxID=2660554 RepID=UPI00129B388B|nr:hypothetical protein [Paenibacillus sp. B01]QGG57360.1 hypothetical protein GE073_18345 [Paenibacillus sp. B01]
MLRMGKGGRTIVLAAMLLLASAALDPFRAAAHVVTSANAYADISLSPAQEEIVLLTGMGIIAYSHDETTFRPLDKLKRSELAYWAAEFHRQAEAGATAEQAARSALSAGLIGSLDGNADYGDVNRAFFGGELTLEPSGKIRPDDELTREQFAAFVSERLQEPLSVGTLPEQAGYESGPAGIVERVVVEEERDGYDVQIGDQSYRLYEHPRVMGASSDPAQWEGQVLVRSWTKPDAADSRKLALHVLDFSAAEAGADADAGAEANADAGGAAGTHADAGADANANAGADAVAGHAGHAAAGEAASAQAQPEGRLSAVVVGAVSAAALLFLLAAAAARRRRRRDAKPAE